MDIHAAHGRTAVVACAVTSALAASPAAWAGGNTYGQLRAELQRAEADARGITDEVFSGIRHLDQAQLVEEVVRRNPTVHAARAGWRAALARVPQEAALEDPMLSYGIAPGSAFDRETRLGQSVQLEQRFPFPGKLRLRREVALADAEMARESWEETRLRLALTAALLHSDWYVAHRALEINAEHIQLLEDVKKSAEAQYVAGRASQQDPLQAEVELSNLLTERVALERHRETVRAEINGLLHRRPQAEVPAPPEGLDLTEAPLPATEELQELALRQRPELAAARATIEGREAAIELSRRAYYPDFGVMGSYNSMWMDTAHQYMVGVSVNVPIYLGKRRAAVDEARASLSRSTSEQERLQDDIRVEVESARQRLVEAIRVVRLHRTRLVPAANDQVAAARAGFETGRNSFLAVIEAEKNLRSVELRAQMALADVRRRDAELARALGSVPPASDEGDVR